MSGTSRDVRSIVGFMALATLFLVALSACQGPTSIEAKPGVGKYSIEVKTDPITLNPPQLATLSYKITNNDTKKVVPEFERVDGALLHNIVIRDDLQYFRHTSTNSTVRDAASVLTFFPTTGKYHTFTLFQPAGEPLQVYTATVTTGEGEDHADMIVDESRAKLSGGLRVELLTGSDAIRANEPTQLAFRVTERGRPVTDLWPLYEAPGHLWVVDEHSNDFAHLTASSSSRRLVPEAVTGTPRPIANFTPGAVTPGPTFASGVAAALASATSAPVPTFPAVQQTAQSSVLDMPDVQPIFGYGPELAFTHTFPHEGLYKMWLEIERNDLTLQYDYFVRVAP